MPALVQFNDPTRAAERGQINQWMIEVNQELAAAQRTQLALEAVVATLKADIRRLEHRVTALETAP